MGRWGWGELTHKLEWPSGVRQLFEHLSWRLCSSEQSASDHVHQWSASFSSRIGRSVLTPFGSCKQRGLEISGRKKGSLFLTGGFLIREDKYKSISKNGMLGNQHRFGKPPTFILGFPMGFLDRCVFQPWINVWNLECIWMCIYIYKYASIYNNKYAYEYIYILNINKCIYIYMYMYKYVHAFLPTYIHTFMTLHFITLQYIALHCNNVHFIINTQKTKRYIHVYIYIYYIYIYISYHTIPYHTMPCHAMPCHYILHHTIPYHTIPYHTIPYHTIPYHTIPHSIAQHSTAQHIQYILF